MPSDRHDGQHSFALLLALWYVALVVYASLYPFHSWRDQGVSPWDYLWAPWPRYWTNGCHWIPKFFSPITP